LLQEARVKIVRAEAARYCNFFMSEVYW
jgi:hypothetical protein